MSAKTPTVAGYARGIAIGLSVLAAQLVLLAIVSPDLATAALAVLIVLGLPVGVVGAVVLHLALGHVRRQGIHVLGAAILGVAGVYAATLVFGLTPYVLVLFAVPAGFASAIGRAVVEPRR